MPRWSLALFAVCCALVVATAPARAEGEPVAVALEWSLGAGAQGCADATSLRDRVRGQTERNSLISDGAASVVIRGRTERVGKAWQATIRVFSSAGAELGKRQLREDSGECSAFDEALVVVLAMMVDSSMVDEASQPVSQVERAAPAARSPVAAPAPAAPTGAWRFAAAASAAVAVGRLPNLGLAAELAGRAEAPWLWPVELGISVSTEELAESMASGSTFRWAAASLLTCPIRRSASVLAFESCAGVQAGVIRSHGFGFRDNRVRRSLALDLRLEQRAELGLSRRWFLRAALGAWLPLVRPGFSYQTDTGSPESLYDPWIIAGFGQIGLGARFR